MNFSLERDRFGGLVLVDASGARFEDVFPARAFPLSDPARSISLCGPDGHELIYIQSLEELPAEVRAVIEAELAQREFAPVIFRVLNTPSDTEPSTWQVETDRGEITFEVEREECIHRREPCGVSMLDSSGIRYEVPDVRKLDAHSRRILEGFL